MTEIPFLVAAAHMCTPSSLVWKESYFSSSPKKMGMAATVVSDGKQKHKTQSF
jgi:hypothetical protein